MTFSRAVKRGLSTKQLNVGGDPDNNLNLVPGLPKIQVLWTKFLVTCTHFRPLYTRTCFSYARSSLLDHQRYSLYLKMRNPWLLIISIFHCSEAARLRAVVNVFVSISEVAPRRARLGYSYLDGCLFPDINVLPINSAVYPSWVSKLSTGLSGWLKAGSSPHLTCKQASRCKYVWSHIYTGD